MTALSATLQTPGESPPAFLSCVIIVGDRLKGSLSSTATAADLIDTLIAFYATANVKESSENGSTSDAGGGVPARGNSGDTGTRLLLRPILPLFSTHTLHTNRSF